MRIDGRGRSGGYAAVMTLATMWLALGGDRARRDAVRHDRRRADQRARTRRHATARDFQPRAHSRSDLRRQEYPNPNRTEAGMIFYNDQGDENGGLVFDGGLKNGEPTNGGSLTFDRWRQDQTLQLVSTEDGADRRVASDRQRSPRHAARFRCDGPLASDETGSGARRADREGRVRQRSPRLAGPHRGRHGRAGLSDPQGRPRLTLGVGKDGEPSVELRDAAGKVTRTLR